jgi:hypothetical protein
MFTEKMPSKAGGRFRLADASRKMTRVAFPNAASPGAGFFRGEPEMAKRKKRGERLPLTVEKKATPGSHTDRRR